MMKEPGLHLWGSHQGATTFPRERLRTTLMNCKNVMCKALWSVEDWKRI